MHNGAHVHRGKAASQIVFFLTLLLLQLELLERKERACMVDEEEHLQCEEPARGRNEQELHHRLVCLFTSTAAVAAWLNTIKSCLPRTS